MSIDIIQSREGTEKWLNASNILRYKIRPDGRVDIKQNIVLPSSTACTVIKFGIIDGSFDCRERHINSLEEWAPEEVKGKFDCSRNNIRSLKGCPSKIGGDFDCSRNPLESLQFGPKDVGGSYNCSVNPYITSLKYAPEKLAGGFFDCSITGITDLKHAPKIINGNFLCNHNAINSFQYGPRAVTGDYRFEFNKGTITSAEGLPERMSPRALHADTDIVALFVIDRVLSYNYDEKYVIDISRVINSMEAAKIKEISPIVYKGMTMVLARAKKQKAAWLLCRMSNMGLLELQETIKRLQPTKGLWYHGDAGQRAHFKDQRMDRDQSQSDLNAQGPGIYFTRSKTQAVGYAYSGGYVQTVEIKPTGKIIKDGMRATNDHISKLIRWCPEERREIGFSNWDENPIKAEKIAIKEYVGYNDLLCSSIAVYHDFYGNHEANEWANSMVAAGYDAYWHILSEVEHLIVYNPKIIRIEKEQTYKEAHDELYGEDHHV